MTDSADPQPSAEQAVTATVITEFSEEGAVAPPTAEIVELLDRTEMFVINTVRPDGRPHSVPLPAMWLDGALYFCTGDGEQKARNLAGNANVTLVSSTPSFRAGTDVVVEGTAAECNETPVLERLAALWQERLDWTFEVRDGHFAEPGFDHQATVYGVVPTKVLAFTRGTPYAQVRYRPAGDR